MAHAAPPAGGPICSYPFNGNANNAAGPQYNGTVVGATLTNDRYGNPDAAYRFNGAGQYIELAGSEGLVFATGGFTLAAWIRLGVAVSDGEAMVVAKHLGGYPNGYFLDVRRPASVPEFFVNDDPRLTGGASVDDGRWHHVVGVFDGSTQHLYVDGQLHLSQPTVPSVSPNDTPIAIGRCYPADGYPEPEAGRYFAGDIDDVAIFDRPLTPEEIQWLFDPPTPVGASTWGGIKSQYR